MKIIKQILVPLLLGSCFIQGMESTHPQKIEAETRPVSFPSQIPSFYKLLSYIISLPLPLDIQRLIAAWWLETLLSCEYSVYKEIEVKDLKSVALSADGKTALAGNFNSVAIVWNAETGEELCRLNILDSVYSAALSKDGKTALTVSTYRAIVWNVEKRKKLYVLEGYAGTNNSVALSADGKIALIGYDNRTAIVWDTTTGEQLKVLEGHKGRVNSVALSKDGKTALTGSADGTVIMWDTKTGKKLQLLDSYANFTALTKPYNCVYSVALSKDGKTALTGHYNGTAILWNTETGKLLQVLTGIHTEHKLKRLAAGDDPITSIALNTNCKTAFTRSRGGVAIFWDTTTGKELKKLPVDNSLISSVDFGVDFGLDGDRIIIGLKDKIILLKRISSKGKWAEERTGSAYEVTTEKTV